MRRLRALIFTVTCVFGTVLASAGATGSDRSDFCAATAVDRAGCEEHLGAVVTRMPTEASVSGGPRVVAAGGPDRTDAGTVQATGSESGGGPRVVPPAEVSPVVAETEAIRQHGRTITATAVMHVPTPEQPASEGQMAPLTDKAMVLLIGWVMLVLLGGGVCAGGVSQGRRRRVPTR